MDKNAIAGPYRFSFWESFSRVIEAIDDYAEIGLSRDEIERAKMRLAYDITQYGAWMREPDWDAYDPRVRCAMRMTWEGILPNLKASQKSCATGGAGGKVGGRGNKKGAMRGGSRREGFGEAPEVIVDYGGDLIGWDETSISRDLK